MPEKSEPFKYGFVDYITNLMNTLQLIVTIKRRRKRLFYN